MIKKIFADAEELASQYSAQAVTPVQGELIWMLDKDAAAKLTS